jgi:hypothetical protein
MLEMSDVVCHFTNSGMESIMRSRCLQCARALVEQVPIVMHCERISPQNF